MRRRSGRAAVDAAPVELQLPAIPQNLELLPDLGPDLVVAGVEDGQHSHHGRSASVLRLLREVLVSCDPALDQTQVFWFSLLEALPLRRSRNCSQASS